ncbi:MAG: hypothetical protein ACOY90_10695 [Candidatus Zhuqueibacterota bacterium]
MKYIILKNLARAGLLLLLFGTGVSFSQQKIPRNSVATVGYVDKNKDGINDLFADGNGDGVNDVSNLQYAHQFQYQDKNNDGVNDLWRDKDGDGINDLMIAILKARGIRPEIPWVDHDGDGLQDSGVKAVFKADLSEFVLDADSDGANDISGIRFASDNTMGYRYGCIDEETSDEPYSFKDKNGDGMHDSFADRFEMDKNQYGSHRFYDYFIDNDGDGISDGRRFQRSNKGKMGQSHGKKNAP